MKTYTETELRLAQREAYVAGSWYGEGPARLLAAEKYPLPKITRPRVVTARDAHGVLVRLKIEHGKVWRSGTANPDQWCESWYPPEYYVAVADLAANPTETVDAE